MLSLVIGPEMMPSGIKKMFPKKDNRALMICIVILYAAVNIGINWYFWMISKDWAVQLEEILPAGSRKVQLPDLVLS